MKQLFKTTIFLFIIGAFTFSVQAQNVDEIIAKHIKAHGGKENWDKVKSMKLTGQFTSFSTTEKFETYKDSQGYYYSEFHLGQHPVVEASNGTQFWTIDPWQDILYPRNANKAEVNVFLQKMELCTPFLNYKEKGSTVAYEGKENVEGVDVFKLKLTRSNGTEEIWYLNAETYLEYKMESQWINFAFPSQQVTFFDDFRKIDGLILPFYFEREFGIRHRVTEIENIELNTDFDTKKCDLTRSKAMQKLAYLEGEWDVSLEVMTRRGTWYPIGATTSKFEFTKTNLLQEVISYDRIFQYNKIINYTFNLDNNKYVVSAYSDINSNIVLFNGAMSDTLFSYENTQVSTDTLESGEHKTKYEITKPKDGEFYIYSSVSRDSGKTWVKRDKFKYTRKKQ